MKKIYTLLVLCCVGLSAIAQTVTVNATGAAGSFKTGYVFNTTTPTLTDGNMDVKYTAAPTASAGMKRGWAVFNMAAVVPAGATITAVTLRLNIITLANTANPLATVNGYNGDMSTITNPATVYANCALGSSLMTPGNFGTTTGINNYSLNAAGISFISTAAGLNNIISLGLNCTSNAGQTYTFTGETGTAATQPQLVISYVCAGLTAAAASATPQPVCIGTPLTLTGTVTGTAASYSWTGPGGFTSTQQNPTPFNATAASAGTYTFSAAVAPGGCAVTNTVTVTTATSPTPISGTASACKGTSAALFSSPASGIWTINGTTGATINSSGLVTTGAGAGTSTVTYTLGSCKSTATFTTLDTPAAITLNSYICGSRPTTLSTTPTGGAWTVNPSSVASIDPVTGEFLGISNGTANITYTGTNGCRTRNATQVIMPPASSSSSSTGSYLLCPAHGLTLTNAVMGGIWSVSGSNVTVNSTGDVMGVSLGASLVIYTNTCGADTTTIGVNPPPPPVTGTFTVCRNSSVTLHNANPGGVWSSANTSVATAAAGFGTITGANAGTTTITYTDVTGCTATTPFTVKPIPTAIFGTANTCIGTTAVLSDTTIDVPAGTWASADSFTAKIIATGSTTATIKGISANTTTITYTATSTGCSVTTPFTVNPLPVAISGNNTFCALKADTLHNLSLGGMWTSSDTNIAKINANGLVTGMSSAGGTATITYTLPTGCIRTRPVIFHPSPVPVITYDAPTSTISTGTYYTSYQWYQDGVATVGATGYRYAAADYAAYSVFVTDTFGCQGKSATYGHSLGINGTSLASHATVQPNPTTGMIQIVSPIAVDAVVTSMEGKVIYQQIDAKTMDLSSLPTGMYMIMLFDQSGRKVATEKLIKQ